MRRLEAAPKGPEDLASLAGLYHRAGRLAEADAAMRRAIDLAPERPDFHTRRGAVLYDLGRVAEAVRSLQAARDLSGGLQEEAEAQLSLATLTLRYVVEPIGAAEEEVRRTGGSAEARTALACALLLRGDLAGALRELRCALAPSRRAAAAELSGRRTAATALAFLYTLMPSGRVPFERAVREVTRALRARELALPGDAPEEARLLLHAGEIYEAAVHEEGAAACYARALAADPTDPAAYDVAARFAAAGAPEAGVLREAVERALAAARGEAELRPQDPAARRRLAFVLLGAARFFAASPSRADAASAAEALSAAREILSERLRGGDHDATAALAFADLLEREGESGQAALLLDRARRWPEGAGSWRVAFEWAALLMRTGRLREAVAEFERARALAPTEPAIAHAQRLAIANLRRLEIERFRFRRAGRGQAPTAEEELRMGLAHLAAGQVEEAMTRLRGAIASEPEYAPAHDAMGLALRRLGRREEAEAAFRRALEIDPSLAPAHRHLAEARIDEASSSGDPGDLPEIVEELEAYLFWQRPERGE